MLGSISAAFKVIKAANKARQEEGGLGIAS